MSDDEQQVHPEVFAEPVPAASQPSTEGPAPPPGKKVYRQIVMPTPEQMMSEEFMNNCGTRTVMSGVMGLGLGVLFGVVMGSMDGAVRPPPPPPFLHPPATPMHCTVVLTGCRGLLISV